MNSYILSLSTAVPPHHFSQEELSQKFIHHFNYQTEKKELIQKIYKNSAIRKRHSVLDDFNSPHKEWKFWGADYPEQIPGMSARNSRYKETAPQLAEEAARSAILQWGRDPSAITHVISISCTGVIAPGIEYLLMNKLGLPSTVNRLGINFMGCFGAFKGLSVANAFAKENPKSRILVVCIELCSLHMQADGDYDTIMGNCLFADGCSAVIIGAEPLPSEKALWEIVRIHSQGISNTVEKMSWEAGDQGFFLRLSAQVPVILGRHIKAFVKALLQDEIPLEHCDFVIHPGGKSILQTIEKTLSLQSDQTTASWETLANYGNVSSATILFILAELSKQKTVRPWSIGLGFGPGLSAESVLLKNTFASNQT